MFNVGQTVYCAAHGKGKVVQIEKGEYPIRVVFETREEVNYTFDGKMRNNLDRCLFFSKPTVGGATEPQYEPKLKPGETVIVLRNNGKYMALEVLEDFKDHVMSANGFAYDKASYQFFKIGEQVE